MERGEDYGRTANLKVDGDVCQEIQNGHPRIKSFRNRIRAERAACTALPTPQSVGRRAWVGIQIVTGLQAPVRGLSVRRTARSTDVCADTQGDDGASTATER